MVYTSLSVYYWSQLVYMHLNRVYNYAFVVLYVSTYHSHACRLLVEYHSQYSGYRKEVVWHIPSAHGSEVSKPSVVVSIICNLYICIHTAIQYNTVQVRHV